MNLSVGVLLGLCLCTRVIGVYLEDESATDPHCITEACKNKALAAKLDGLNSHLEPKIAMQCDFVNMHLDTTSGEWIPDKNNKSDCLTEKMDILEYCRKVYPNIDITNVVEAADSVKISNWCKGEHKLCKWHHVVKPYRCLVGPFQSDPLLVPEHCLFDHVHNAARCWTFDRWNATADESCSNRAMRLSSFAMLLPCGIDMFSGVEFVCCPGNDDAAVPTSASPGVRDTDRYFFHVSQEEEHEEFRAALQRVEEKHRSKVTKVMKEWAELEDRYQDMKKNDPNAAETFKKEMTTRFQKTVEALEDEGQAEKRQVVAVHQQRVEARINDNKRVAMETYRQALVQIPPQAHKILKALQKYMRAEEKDRTHSVNHFKHLKRTDPETAQQLQSSVQAHLVKIEERINQSVAMLQKLPEIARKIAPQVESLVEDFKYTEVDVKFADGSVWVPADVSLVESTECKEVVEEDIASDDSSESDDDDTTIQTTTADDSNDAIDSEDHVKKDADDADADADDDDDDNDDDDDVDDDDDDDDDDVYYDEAEDEDENQDITTGNRYDEDDDDYEDEEDAVTTTEASEKPEIELHVEETIVEIAKKEKEAVKEAIVHANEVVQMAHHSNDLFDVEQSFMEEEAASHTKPHTNSFYFLASLGGIAVLTAVVVGALVARRHQQQQPQRFAPVETRDVPEERHVVSMQNSGYENPTYKYFESYSS
ncbi:PREDICTED: amyloid beta A4 protein-like [Priapulus caudatus]|uniref:Amyloid beta A4 protein-like n=1 Tax=Priapulus caudatus TaxID=37621 RepID=A0ABM1EA71_PRICU|nr:PREDICTED: amyloid beta A4 protein-like [Priapulus caudatus]